MSKHKNLFFEDLGLNFVIISQKQDLNP